MSPRPPSGLAGRLQALARERAQRKDPVTPPPPPGRDPLVHRGTDKAQFCRGDWRSVPLTDWRPYRPGGGGGGVRDRKDRERDRAAREKENERRAETDRRGEELKEAWRQRHPEKDKTPRKRGE